MLGAGQLVDGDRRVVAAPRHRDPAVVVELDARERIRHVADDATRVALAVLEHVQDAVVRQTLVERDRCAAERGDHPCHEHVPLGRDPKRRRLSALRRPRNASRRAPSARAAGTARPRT